MRSLRTQHSHFDLGVESACSAASRGPPRKPPLGHPPSSCSSPSAFLSYEAFPHAEVRRLRIHVSCGSALPSSGPTSSFMKSPNARELPVRGRTDVLSRPRVLGVFQDRIRYLLAFCPVLPRSRFALGRPDVFPGRDCV